MERLYPVIMRIFSILIHLIPIILQILQINLTTKPLHDRLQSIRTVISRTRQVRAFRANIIRRQVEINILIKRHFRVHRHSIALLISVRGRTALITER